MPETSSISAFVLAGGQSTRMGQDKAMLLWRGRTLLDHMIHLLSEVFGPVRVVGRQEDLPDHVSGRGPLGGIATALAVMETRRAVIVAVDLPLLTPEFLRMFRVRVEASPKHVIACKIGSSYPLCLGVSVDVSGLLHQRIQLGQLSVNGFIDAADSEVIEGLDSSLFLNVNTRDDWQRLLDADLPRDPFRDPFR